MILFSEGVGFTKEELIGLDHINLVDEEYGNHKNMLTSGII